MRIASLLLLLLLPPLSWTQEGFPANWFSMVSATQSQQPHWITPLNTTTPRLEQEFRYDMQWQTHNNGVTTDNYGVSKGLEIIPARNVEVILGVPAYVVNNPDSKDGFGDWQFLVKYRIAAANEEHGNYILTAFYQMSFPTGQYQQGVSKPVITPTIAYGKGIGDFDIQGTMGISLPTGNLPAIGRNFLCNNTFQYRLFKKIWPETEVNLTHYYQGSHNGHTSVYLTPGIVLGRFRLWDRLGFTVGGGFEIAATSFHPTNHIPIFSMRFPF
ncbi:MAG TPA: hypothetical protein VH350_14800 [Candidatus Sulfotelmatobacter sp.]|nr:hypothetical protein [Candidatus Sulfotelmatobacter sp.]